MVVHGLVNSCRDAGVHQELVAVVLSKAFMVRILGIGPRLVKTQSHGVHTGQASDIANHQAQSWFITLYPTSILTHLLKNAAEYTPAEGKITIEFKKRGQHKIEFHVSDTGSGIPEEKREDVFKPFLEIHDLTKGDGLGLPTCKQMALKMGGDLTIDSEYIRGTRFVLELKA